MSVLERIQGMLKERGVAFEVQSHRPVYTSVEAAEVRGEDLRSGAKALIVKADASFVLLVLPGDCRIDRRKVRRNLGFRGLRFATVEEVEEQTGLTPGAIPPFGSVLGMQTFCDLRLSEQPWINFNAGAHTMSIRIRYEEYVRVEGPTVADFAVCPERLLGARS